MSDNSDLTDDYWALNAALQYASEAFENDTSDANERDEADVMLSRAYEALDAFKSRLGL